MKIIGRTKLGNLIFASILAWMLLVGGSALAQKPGAASDVDLALVIALDVSGSISVAEYQIMRQGLARALTTRQISQAIEAGNIGAIAINVVQWSGFQEQQMMIGWTRVATFGDLQNLADRVLKMQRRYEGGATDIGGALDFTRSLVEKAGFTSARQVIDIAADGTNNVNNSPNFARDRTLDQGITINGLVITTDSPFLAEYFIRFVIGGSGAFVEQAGDYDGFERAMRKKLLREIGAQYLF